MPYSNSVTVLATEGGPTTTPVVARLWKLNSPSFGNHHYDTEVEKTQAFQVNLGGSPPAPFSFAAAATFPHDPVGLSIQNESGVAPTVLFHQPGSPDIGWLFRSGAFANFLPSTSPIDIITGECDITPADVPSLLPATPLPVGDAKTTITGLDATLQDAAPGGVHGGIDLTATGTTTAAAGSVGFTFGGRLVPTPSTDIAEPTAEAIAIEFTNEHEQLLGGANLPLGAEQDLWWSVSDFVKNTVVPQIRRNVESRVAGRIADAVGRPLGSGGLPAGVILSVRALEARSQALVVHGALGSFGSVVSKLPQPGGSGSCALTTLASLGHAVSGLTVLREVRDGALAGTATGRWATDAYYRFGAEASSLLAGNPRLAARAAALAEEIAAVLRAGRGLRPLERRRCDDLLRDLAALGSPELRATVAHGLDVGVTRLL